MMQVITLSQFTNTLHQSMYVTNSAIIDGLDTNIDSAFSVNVNSMSPSDINVHQSLVQVHLPFHHQYALNSVVDSYQITTN